MKLHNIKQLLQENHDEDGYEEDGYEEDYENPDIKNDAINEIHEFIEYKLDDIYVKGAVTKFSLIVGDLSKFAEYVTDCLFYRKSEIDPSQFVWEFGCSSFQGAFSADTRIYNFRGFLESRAKLLIEKIKADSWFFDEREYKKGVDYVSDVVKAFSKVRVDGVTETHNLSPVDNEEFFAEVFLNSNCPNEFTFGKQPILPMTVEVHFNEGTFVLSLKKSNPDGVKYAKDPKAKIVAVQDSNPRTITVPVPFSEIYAYFPRPSGKIQTPPENLDKIKIEHLFCPQSGEKLAEKVDLQKVKTIWCSGEFFEDQENLQKVYESVCPLIFKLYVPSHLDVEEEMKFVDDKTACKFFEYVVHYGCDISDFLKRGGREIVAGRKQAMQYFDEGATFSDIMELVEAGELVIN